MKLTDLYQSEVWNGQRLEDMAVGHRVNLVRWLERNADRLHAAEAWQLAGFDECGDPWGDESDLEWLHATPLVERLDELIGADRAPRARAWLRNRWFHLRRAVAL